MLLSLQSNGRVESTKQPLRVVECAVEFETFRKKSRFSGILIDWIHNKAWFILHHKWAFPCMTSHVLLKFRMGD